MKSSDEVFPRFIVESLPTGLAGLLVAGVLASAMGTLSSSISSLASSTYLDLFRLTPWGRSLKTRGEMRVSRLLTLFWGIALIGGAMIFTDSRNPVVEIGLKIASFTYGGLLGTFLLGIFFSRTTGRDALAGFVAGLGAMAGVIIFSNIDFVWHTMIGCLATIICGNLSALFLPRMVPRVLPEKNNTP